MYSCCISSRGGREGVFESVAGVVSGGEDVGGRIQGGEARFAGGESAVVCLSLVDTIVAHYRRDSDTHKEANTNKTNKQEAASWK